MYLSTPQALRKLSLPRTGTFRNQVDDATDSRNADTVGGTFKVDGVMRGGVVVTRD